MCVIAVCLKERLTERMVEQMWKDSPHMGGVAWREKVKGVEHVFWKKGLNLKQMHDVAKNVTLPAVYHFRKQTSGGECAELNHPFPVTRKVETLLEGHTQGAVLFHNGTVMGWEDRLLRACVDFKLQIPDDELSDTRALAFLTSVYGKNYLSLLPEQKGIYFSPTELHYYTGGPNVKDGWVKRNDVWVSQTRWDTQDFTKRICTFEHCMEPAMNDGRCYKHPLGRGNIVTPLGPVKVFTSPFAEAVVKIAESQKTAGLLGSKAFRRIKSLMETMVHNQETMKKAAQGKESTALILPKD